MKKLLNCIGLACPIPVVEAKKAIAGFTEPGELTVLADNETCVQNLTRLAKYLKLPVSHAQTGEKEYTVRFTVTAEAAARKANAEQAADSLPVRCDVPAGSGTAVVIASDRMGDGDEKLGRALLKAFLFALTSTPEPPAVMLFYNTGAYMTCEGSDSLEDLKNLAEAGTKIYTCGTCLNFYGLTETLKVGEITNMYDIVEMQQQAAKIIRP